MDFKNVFSLFYKAVKCGENRGEFCKNRVGEEVKKAIFI